MKVIKGRVLNCRPDLNIRRYYVDEETGCHVWMGAISDGYGKVGTNRGGTYRVHVIAWEALHGPVPQGMMLDHLCRNRACLNPDHLEPVTNAENSRRGAKAKLNWVKVRAIRQLRKTKGLSHRALAKLFDVSSVSIHRILTNKRWREDEC
jgi:hypothetical protein